MFIGDLSRLAERAANTSSPAPPQLDISQRLDKVHDAFGPGAFFAWVLTAYSVMSQYHSPPQGPMYWSLDKDLAATLLYPAIVAGQLIHKINRYPDSRNELWSSTSRNVKTPDAAPIWACAQVCLTASGMNVFFLVALRKSRFRFYSVAVVSTWIFVALCYAWIPGHDFGEAVVLGTCLGLYVPILFAVSPWTLFGGAYILLSTFGGLRRAASDLPHFLEEPGFFIWCIAMGLYVLAMAVFGAALGVCVPLCYYFLLPASNHSVSDFGQIMALLVALWNVLLAVRTLVDLYGKYWWEGALDLIRAQPPAGYTRLPDGGKGESVQLP